MKSNPYCTKRLHDFPSIELLTKWTNQKAILAGAGKDGTCYKDFVPFTAREFRQHIGVYIFHGLSPSPRVDNKFRPDHFDELHDKHFIYNSFGPNAERRHRHFKAFFSVQDPSIKVPERSLFPNWKVCSILKWLNYTCPLIWLLGIAFSIKKTTMIFQGKHVDKRQITYKNEGDVFQAHAFCQDGFTYQIFMRNYPAPLKYIKEGLSPLQ